MKYILLAFMLLFEITNTLHAQINFQPGYIITLHNDTIHGFLDYKSDISSTKICWFKKDNDAHIQKYNPGEIAGYRFMNGKYYVSKQFKYDNKEQTFFVEYLVNGKVKLYYFRDYQYSEGDVDIHSNASKTFGNNYLFEKENEEPVMLTVKERSYSDHSGITMTYADNQYIGALLYLTNDCKDIIPLIKNASFNHKSMIEITKKYHEAICKDQNCIVYEKSIPNNIYKIIPFVALNNSHLTTSFEIGGRAKTYTLTNVTNPTFGVKLTITNPVLSERFALDLTGELSYFHLNDKIEPYLYYPSYLYYPIDITIKYFSVKQMIGIQYQFPKWKVRPLIEVGGLSNALLFDKTKANYKFTIYGYDNQLIFSNYLVGYYVSVGMDLYITKKTAFYIAGTYDYSQGISHVSKDRNTSLTNSSLRFGIMF